MKLYLPSREEACELLKRLELFRGYTICDGALPPAFILKAGLNERSTNWLMPRLFCDELTGRIVGSGGFKTEPRDRRIEIGYGVAPAVRRRGYATQAVRLLVEEAFCSNGIDEVVAETASSNAASKRVLEKAGFCPNGSGAGNEGPVDYWILRR